MLGGSSLMAGSSLGSGWWVGLGGVPVGPSCPVGSGGADSGGGATPPWLLGRGVARWLARVGWGGWDLPERLQLLELNVLSCYI